MIDKIILIALILSGTFGCTFMIICCLLAAERSEDEGEDHADDR